MQDVSVIVPNYNGEKYLPRLLASLKNQTGSGFRLIFVDNGSDDGSTACVKGIFPEARIIALGENTGFAHAVNEGIRAASTELVLLLNNDTEVEPDFIARLREGMERHPDAFSCAACMVRFDDRGKLDDAGDYYCALGWAYAAGKNRPVSCGRKEKRIFASCAGAALYRRSLLDQTGLFDEEHFAYLEDIDLAYRARILGYHNYYIPQAVVYHVGSGTSGSRYNTFKTRYSSRNNIYMVYKNMPLPQLILNFPFLAAGFLIKQLFYVRKGMGREYLAGIKNGIELCRPPVKFRPPSGCRKHYIKIQLELWLNGLRLLLRIHP